MKISIIVAVADDLLIGANNKLLWHLPADFAHFKKLTLGKSVVMGRKTFESIGKPLPNRRNIVISRNKNLKIPGCEIVNSLEAAIELLQNEMEIMILGGAQIYQLALPIADVMYLTFVHNKFKGDAYFPQWDQTKWQEVSREDHKADVDNIYDYSFVMLINCPEAD